MMLEKLRLINDKFLVNTPGEFSAYNSVCAIMVTNYLGCNISSIKKALSRVAVKGRMEIVPVSDKYSVIIDYAHSHLEFEKVMEYLNRHSNSNLIVVVGAGGMRNTFNRSFIGQVTTSNSSKVIFTEDNSRTEDVKKIISDLIFEQV